MTTMEWKVQEPPPPPDEAAILRSNLLGCSRCELRAGCKSPVPWSGPTPAEVMFFGEAPGEREDQSLTPFTGTAGQEFDGLLFQAFLERNESHVSNVVRCRPPGNATPKDANVAACMGWTMEEIRLTHPKLIVAMGATAIRALLPGNMTVTEAHGKPFEGAGPFGITVFATTHPAAGLHNNKDMKQTQDDFIALKEYMNGEWKPVVDELAGREAYAVLRGEEVDRLVESWLADSGCTSFSCDTEWTPDNKVWCASICNEPGVAYVIMAEDLQRLRPLFESLHLITTLHQAGADIDSLQTADPPIVIDARRVGDTMIAAYILGLPQGLKTLARLECGMEMRDYMEVVGPYQRLLEVSFFERILEEVIEPTKEKGDRKQTIHQKIRRAIGDLAKDPECDWRGRWENWDESQKAPVIGQLGDYPTASLADVPFDEAAYYSARDADATERVKRNVEKKMKAWNSFRI